MKLLKCFESIFHRIIKNAINDTWVMVVQETYVFLVT